MFGLLFITQWRWKHLFTQKCRWCSNTWSFFIKLIHHDSHTALIIYWISDYMPISHVHWIQTSFDNETTHHTRILWYSATRAPLYRSIETKMGRQANISISCKHLAGWIIAQGGDARTFNICLCLHYQRPDMSTNCDSQSTIIIQRSGIYPLINHAYSVHHMGYDFAIYRPWNHCHNILYDQATFNPVYVSYEIYVGIFLNLLSTDLWDHVSPIHRPI